MSAFPRTFLFPDWRRVLGWGAVAAWLAFAASVGFPSTPASFNQTVSLGTGRIPFVLSVAVLGALWATYFVRRLRSWPGGLFVPGYARTAFATAIGIVILTAVSSTILVLVVWDPVSEASGYFPEVVAEVVPLIGLACLAGFSVLFGLTYTRRGISYVALGVVVFATVFADGTPFGYRVSESWHWVGHPAFSGLILILAVALAVLVRRRLALPVGAEHGRTATPALHFYPLVFGPSFGFRGTRTTLPELLLVAVTASLASRPFDVVAGVMDGSMANAVSLAVFGVACVGSLTPLGLLKGGGTWMAVTWQLGKAESRRDLGRRFVLRVVAVTFATLGLVLAIVGAHALFGDVGASPIDHQDHFDEALLLYTAGFVACTWACSTGRWRTLRQPSQASAVAIVCAVVLVAAFSGFSLQWPGRAILLGLLAASALLAVYVGGRAISRIDFLAAKDE